MINADKTPHVSTYGVKKYPGVKDIIGLRFGRWVVLERKENTPRGALRFLCRCDCGTEKIVSGTTLRNGTSDSCGCYCREVSSITHIKHGHATHDESGEFTSWRSMKARCSNPNNASFARYGGRGIAVCDRWINSFEAFYEDMGNKPSSDHSLERINSDAGYSKDNCRWATWKEQANNKVNNVWHEWNGETLTTAQWATKLGLNYRTLRARLFKYGWTLARALSNPARIKRPHQKFTEISLVSFLSAVCKVTMLS